VPKKNKPSTPRGAGQNSKKNSADDSSGIVGASGYTDNGDLGISKSKTRKKDDVILTASSGAVNVTVQAKPDESADSLLRRFNREVMRAGVMRRLKELEFYEKPSTKKKKERKMRVQRIKDYERWAE
jgi:small subunit ribosomal protein S21